MGDRDPGSTIAIKIDDRALAISAELDAALAGLRTAARAARERSRFGEAAEA